MINFLSENFLSFFWFWLSLRLTQREESPRYACLYHQSDDDICYFHPKIFCLCFTTLSLSPREPVAPSGRHFPGPAGWSWNGQADEEGISFLALTIFILGCYTLFHIALVDETEGLLRQTFDHLMSVCFGPDARAKAVLHTSLRFAVEGVAYGTAKFPTAKVWNKYRELSTSTI